MRIRNPFLLNDWEMSKTLQAVVLIQAVVLLSLCLAYFGFDFPIIHVPISFVYLTFIPGILLLRVMRLHELGNLRTLLYSMGLSLSFVMAVGVVMNAVFPRIGLANPISLIPLVVVLTSLVSLLCLLSYVRDGEFSNPVYVNISFGSLSPQVLLLCLLPFLTIFATFLMNYNGTNSLQMLLLLIIMAIPFVVVLGWIPQKHYAFLLFVVSFSLLFHTALLSSYVWGSDNNPGITLSRLVLQSGVWNLSIASDQAGMLSLVMLAPIYSLFSNISLPLVFKIFYPFIFSFVPLGLFVIYRRQTGDKIAFLSCFYFMTFEAFFVAMPQTARQEIAELFLILIVLLVVEDRLRMSDRSLLLIVFGAALCVSHYGTSYIFLILLALALPITYVARAFKTNSTRGTKGITIFALFFAIFTLSWYIYVSPFSQPLVTAVSLGNVIVSNVGEMFNPAYNQPVAFLTKQLVPFQTIERDIYLLSLFFILVGFIAVLLEKKETEFKDEFMGFAFGSVVFLVLAGVLPFVAQALQSDRVITISFILLAPFCIIGLIRLLGLLRSPIKHVTKREGPFRTYKNKIYVVVSIFLAIWVVFNSAFVYQLFDQPKIGRFALDTHMDFLRLNEQELSNAAWLSNYLQNGSVGYSDVNKATLLNGLVSPTASFNHITTYEINATNYRFHHPSYIFLGSYNLEHNSMLIGNRSGSPEYVPTAEMPQASVIFNNGGSTVLLVN